MLIMKNKILLTPIIDYIKLVFIEKVFVLTERSV
jgi:hypothetical protein